MDGNSIQIDTDALAIGEDRPNELNRISNRTAGNIKATMSASKKFPFPFKPGWVSFEGDSTRF